MTPTSVIPDPVHVFVRVSPFESAVINSRPFQRLRHIHQLALSSLVYPGANHTRFEHSLGVMELAGRIFDVVINTIPSSVRDIFPPPTDLEREYFRQVVRISALFHDVGHLPFSHAGEKLLPSGWTHERLTLDVILSDEMREVWATQRLEPMDLAKIALGEEKFCEFSPGYKFTPMQLLMSTIITGDSFGADRIDYLLRDGFHSGASSGRFDHHKLIETLRILPDKQDGKSVCLGLMYEGLDTAETMALARLFMYSQVYFHPVRKVYDLHLEEFLSLWLPDGVFSTDLEDHYRMTDNDVYSAIRAAAVEPEHPAHEPACAIEKRLHYRLLYSLNQNDVERNPACVEIIKTAAIGKYGADAVKHYKRKAIKMGNVKFPVLVGKDEIVQSTDLSKVLAKLEPIDVEYIYIHPRHEDEARSWLNYKTKQQLLD